MAHEERKFPRPGSCLTVSLFSAQPTSNSLGLARIRRREEGLALLDVLLGMAIFALIAVIAVQAMGQFRDRATRTQMVSDTKQVISAVTAAQTMPGAEPFDWLPAVTARLADGRPDYEAMIREAEASVTNAQAFQVLAQSASYSDEELRELGINLTDETQLAVMDAASYMEAAFGIVELPPGSPVEYEMTAGREGLYVILARADGKTMTYFPGYTLRARPAGSSVWSTSVSRPPILFDTVF